MWGSGIVLVLMAVSIGLFHGSADALGLRSFNAGAVSPNCSTETRRAAIGCPCALVGVQCADINSQCVTASGRASALAPGICSCSFNSIQIAGTRICSLGFTAPGDVVVPATACPGQNVFNFACGGPQPLTCALSFFNTTSVDIAGNRYTSSQTFLAAAYNSTSRCCYATVTNSAPSTDAFECFAVTATDAAGYFVSDSVCALIKTPPSTLVCPTVATTTAMLLLTASNSNPYLPFCTVTNPTALTLTASGGTSPYTYKITLTNSIGAPPAPDTGFDNQPLVIVDASGKVTPVLDTATGQATAPSITVVQTYTATVTDSKGVTATTSFTVTIQGFTTCI